MIFVLKADTIHLDRGCVSEFDIAVIESWRGPDVGGSYILWSVWLVLFLTPVLPRDAIVRLLNPVDVSLAVSPREGLGGRRRWGYGDGLPIVGSQRG